MPDITVKIAWSVEECNDVAETLTKLAEGGEGIASHPSCDLIVMATHGRGGLQRCCWATSPSVCSNIRRFQRSLSVQRNQWQRSRQPSRRSYCRALGLINTIRL